MSDPDDFLQDIDFDEMMNEIEHPELNPDRDLTFGRTNFDDDDEDADYDD